MDSLFLIDIFCGVIFKGMVYDISVIFDMDTVTRIGAAAGVVDDTLGRFRHSAATVDAPSLCVQPVLLRKASI